MPRTKKINNKVLRGTIPLKKDMYNKLCLSFKEKYKKDEEWKRIIVNGITSKYVVSNYGRVLNIDKLKEASISCTNGHYRAYIKLDDKSTITIGTYRLVAIMFIPIPQKYLDMGYTMDDLVVDHIRDGESDNFNDNTMWNLQWLTERENISKAAKCGIRVPFDKTFRKKLDEMILNDCCNKEIYNFCYLNYGYTKDDVKAMIQVRRRRLGKTLKEHKERPKEYTAKIDELIKKGLTNQEIYKELDMPTDSRSSGRLVQYRREILGILDQKSKFFTNEQNEIVNKLLKEGKTNSEIIEYMKISDKDSDEINKIKRTLSARRRFLKLKNK